MVRYLLLLEFLVSDWYSYYLLRTYNLRPAGVRRQHIFSSRYWCVWYSQLSEHPSSPLFH